MASDEDPADGAYRYRLAFTKSCEDGFLAAGGLAGTVSSYYVGTTNSFAHVYVWVAVLSLSICAIGKSLPSLYAAFSYRIRNPLNRLDGARFPHLRRFDLVEIAGDLSLLILAVAGLSVYLATDTSSRYLWLFLFFIGLGFVAKSLIDLVEDGLLNSLLDAMSGTHKELVAEIAQHGSRTNEDILLAAFGFLAIGIHFVKGGAVDNIPAGALGIAALGKALPSLVQALPSSSKAAGS